MSISCSLRPLFPVFFISFKSASSQSSETCGSSGPANLFNDKNTYQLNTEFPILFRNWTILRVMRLKVRSCYNK